MASSPDPKAKRPEREIPEDNGNTDNTKPTSMTGSGSLTLLNDVAPSTAEAALLVKQARQREGEQRQRAKEKNPEKEADLVLEEVSGWEGTEAGGIDENEMLRKQRHVEQRLENKQREYLAQVKRLQQLRMELKALEEPLKREIFEVRTKLEEVNREESKLVGIVNNLRKDLRANEKALEDTRKVKNEYADRLVNIMADYEKKKGERLEEITDILGEEYPKQAERASSSKKPAFDGF
mmetsp:Transcript_18872/g.32720  ORF Transcript_18872/g.32720 Transcript_18872/m.32720 type:complete len:237 (-) Transcript_18872:459-1169(-)